MDSLALFVVQRTSDGFYFRAVGYGGGGRQWVQELKDVKVYGKIGQARGRVSFWAGVGVVAQIVELTATVTAVHDETSRLVERKRAKERREANSKALMAKRDIDAATSRLEAAKAEVERLRREG